MTDHEATKSKLGILQTIASTGSKEGSWDRRTKEDKDCTIPESSYSVCTLIGNWNEKRFDVSYLSQPKPLPSQYGHYYETTYEKSYSQSPPQVPEVLKCGKGEGAPKAFPYHQTALDSPEVRKACNSFITSSMAAYGHRSTRDTKEDTSTRNTVEKEEDRYQNRPTS